MHQPERGARRTKRTVSPTRYGPLWIRPNELTPRVHVPLFTAPRTYWVAAALLDANSARNETTNVERVTPCRGLTSRRVVALAPPPSGRVSARAAATIGTSRRIRR